MRIAVTNPFCWPEVRRGSERLVHELSHFLAGRGHEVTLFSTAREATGVSWENGERGGRIRRVIFPQRQPLGFRNRWINQFHWFGFQVYRALRAERFDAVHCLNYHDACGALLARRGLAPMRVVYQVAGIAMRRVSLVVPHESLLFAAAARGADAVISVSRFAQESMREIYGHGSLLLPSPTDTAAFSNTPRRSREGALDILFAADMTEPRKGAGLLIAAFAKLLAQRPDATLTMSGHCPAEVKGGLLREVSDDAAARIRFLGVGQVDDLASLYAAATVFVLPSAWEAQGMVLVEALASGTPVVACNHAGVTDIVDDERVGSLFEPGELVRRRSNNVAGLVEAILRSADLAQRPETVTLCRVHAERFGWTRLGPRYENVLTGAPLEAPGEAWATGAVPQ